MASLPTLQAARTYRGQRTIDGSTRVTVDGLPLVPCPELSGTAMPFDWGWVGPGGPTQLTWALLMSHLGDAEESRRYLDHFLHGVVRNLGGAGWSLTSTQISQALPGSLRA